MLTRGGARNRNLVVPALFTALFIAINVGSTYFFSWALENVATTTARSSTEASHGDIVVIATRSLQDEIDMVVGMYGKTRQSTDWAEFRAHPYFDNLDRSARLLFAETKVIKLKVFADDGTTIYSSDPSQVGKIEDGIEQITHALRGRSTSQLDVHASFTGLDGERSNVSVASSYHPVKARNGDVYGVLEVYSDRTSEVTAFEDFSLSQLGNFLVFMAFNAATWFGILMFNAMRHRDGD